MTRRLAFLLPVLALVGAAGAWAARAHEHGLARLDIAVDGKQLTVSFESPLDNLLGFERAPRTEPEHKAAASAVARLHDAATMVRVDPAAACTPRPVSIVSPALKLGSSAAVAGKESEHTDLQASYEFDCQDAARAAWIDLGLFDAFVRLKRIEVQAATAKGQLKAVLRRGSGTRVPLAR